MPDKQNSERLPDSLVWLADAPLFIDADQVGRFYDAVARPQARQGAINLELNDKKVDAIKGKLQIEGSLTTEKLAGLLAPVFAFVKPTLKAGGEVGADSESTRTEGFAIELLPISTPQRELVTLALHYLINHPDRLWFIKNPSEEPWRTATAISQVPRAIAFLDLPGAEEAHQNGTPETKLIPTAAEFQNGKIVQIYQKLRFAEEVTPSYPDRGASPAELKRQRKDYWAWFDRNFSATKAMVAVEEAASENGKIRWIDYRVPISADGDTLHLHVCPAGNFDTGTLAYNFIKRGYKHGIRLVGTLKSEPDMNVLAIYEK